MNRRLHPTKHPKMSHKRPSCPSLRIWLKNYGGKKKPFVLVVRMFFLVIFLLIALVVYLHVVGFPGFAREALIRKMDEAGCAIRLQRIRLDFVEGLVAEHVRIFTDRSRSDPLIEAEQVVLKFEWAAWFHQPLGLRSIRILNANFHLGQIEPLANHKDVQSITLRDVQGVLKIEAGGIRIHHLEGVVGKVPVNVHGFIVWDPDPSSSTTSMRFMDVVRARVKSLSKKNVSWIYPLVEAIAFAQFDQVPHLDVEFLIHTDSPDLNEIILMTAGKGVRVRGVYFDKWEVVAHLRDRSLFLPSCTVWVGDQIVEVSGALSLDEKLIEGRVFSTLSPACWTSLIPTEWSKRVADAKMFMGESLEIELLWDPVPIEKVTEHISGWLSLRKAEIHDIWVEKAGVSFEWDKPWLRLESIDAVIGRDHQQGPLRGTFHFNPLNTMYSGSVKTGFDPNAILPVLNDNLTRFVRCNGFKESPPTLEGTFSGTLSDRESFMLSGSIAASNFVYQGIFLESLNTPIYISNRVVTLNPVEINRSEGVLAGSLRQDFADKHIDFKARSTLALKAFSKILGPVIERVFRVIRSEGATTIEGEGRIDYRDAADTDFKFFVDAENLGLKGFLANRCRFKGEAKGPHILLRNVKGLLYGGEFTGQLAFDDIRSKTNISYTLDVMWSNVNFSTVVQNIREIDGDSYRGDFDGQLVLSGRFGEGRGDTIKGRGHAQITDGLLFQIPLFGGLSKLLARLYPRLGFASQTDFKTRFHIKDRKIHVDHFVLEGAFLSVQGSGDYHFNETLDFFIEVLPLGESKLADWIRKLTFPATQLLKFRLGGTLRDPEWRPDNWPQELFDMLDDIF